MNGEMAHEDEEGKEKDPAAAAPGPAVTRSQMFEGVATVHGSVQVTQDSDGVGISIRKPSSAPQAPTVRSTVAPWENSIM